jgi:hypothetical protein
VETLLPGRFVVNRLNWHAGKRGFLRLAGAFPVGDFEPRQQADAERWRLENAARRLVNPFATAPAPYEQTSLPPFALRDWLLDTGIAPPPADADSAGWASWWQAQAPGWSEDLRLKVWERLDRVHFYCVEERPSCRLVYLAVDADRHYGDRWFNSVQRAFRSRAAAQGHCDRLNEEAGWEEFEPVETPAGDPFTNPKACCEFECRPRLESDGLGLPHFEVYELEVDGALEDRVHVVVRNIWLHDSRRYGCNDMEAGPCWAFVRGFGTQEAAEQFRQQQEAATRAVLRPGQVNCSIPEDFTERVKEIGLVPPAELHPGLHRGEGRASEKLGSRVLDWWDSLGGKATAEQRAQVWGLLGDVSFFDVVETDLES